MELAAAAAIIAPPSLETARRPEEIVELRRLRRAVFTIFVDEITTLLTELLGIPVPAEM